jgi:hypothetical protein
MTDIPYGIALIVRPCGKRSRSRLMAGSSSSAQSYLAFLRQSRSAWSLEVEIRPWVETF